MFAFLRLDTVCMLVLVCFAAGVLIYRLVRFLRTRRARLLEEEEEVRIATSFNYGPERSVPPRFQTPTKLPEDWTSEKSSPWASQPLQGDNPFLAVASGEELYRRARKLVHQAIPDLLLDEEYLELMLLSAKRNYAPACWMLGEYAMRREDTVEAYFWMKLAERNGKEGLTSTLDALRRRWVLEGFPADTKTTNWLFTEECALIAHAFLDMDTNHNAHRARTYLANTYPKLLDDDKCQLTKDECLDCKSV